MDEKTLGMTEPVDLPLELPVEDPDIIIIGGGTSGLVVASRLSENPSLQILVIEAGTDRHDDPRVTTPGLAVSLLGDPEYAWQFMSEPQVSNGIFTPTQFSHLGMCLVCSTSASVLH